jgi:hypothetical protein
MTTLGMPKVHASAESNVSAEQSKVIIPEIKGNQLLCFSIPKAELCPTTSAQSPA